MEFYLSKIFNKKIVLHSKNLSVKKNYYSLYNNFKKKYTTSKADIDNILKNDKEFKIYNTPKQQQMYIEILSKFAF